MQPSICRESLAWGGIYFLFGNDMCPVVYWLVFSLIPSSSNWRDADASSSPGPLLASARCVIFSPLSQKLTALAYEPAGLEWAVEI